MISRADDVELLARVAAGDHEAFTTVMQAHEDRVFSVCLRILGNREHALDATQDTFLTTFRKAGQFEGKSALGTWIYRIAVNTCYDLLRREKRRRADALPERLDPVDVQAEEQIDAIALRPELQRALSKLAPEFRSAVVLADIEGMALADVASILDVPVGTVKSRVFRGRRMLADDLGNQRP